jgi:hypothetical protein
MPLVVAFSTIQYVRVGASVGGLAAKLAGQRFLGLTLDKDKHASDLRAALGAPESTVSIPGDDGHLIESCQYWANGEPIGTVHLDNGRVVSVQTGN